jgi:hypothetical protein
VDAHAIEVEPVASAKLELQLQEARCASAPCHVVRRRPDCPRGRGPGRQSEQVQRHAGLLRAEIVEGGVDRGARSLFARWQAIVNLVQRPRVVAEQVAHLGEPYQRRRRRLAVVLDGRRLAAADEVAVPELDLDDVNRVPGLARDAERLGELERHLPGGDVHNGDRMPV